MCVYRKVTSNRKHDNWALENHFTRDEEATTKNCNCCMRVHLSLKLVQIYTADTQKTSTKETETTVFIKLH